LDKYPRKDYLSGFSWIVILQARELQPRRIMEHPYKRRQDQKIAVVSGEL
jgi:hypothetical protein